MCIHVVSKLCKNVASKMLNMLVQKILILCLDVIGGNILIRDNGSTLPNLVAHFEEEKKTRKMRLRIKAISTNAVDWTTSTTA